MIALLFAIGLLLVNAVVYAVTGWPWYVVLGWLLAAGATWKLRAWAWQ